MSMNESTPGTPQDSDETPFGASIDPSIIDEERRDDRAGTETWFGDGAYQHRIDASREDAGQAEAPIVDVRPQDPRRRLSGKHIETGQSAIQKIRETMTFEDPAEKAEKARRQAQEDELRRRARMPRQDSQESTQV